MKLDKYYNTDSTDSDREQEPAEHKHSMDKLGGRLDTLMENKYAILAIALAIIIVNITVRAGLLQYQGLFEPDGFFYYSVIRAEINAHYGLVNYLGISGFPSHNFIGEAPGLPYLTVLFYYMLHGITGLSALTIMRWMPILFGVIYSILGFFLAKQLSKSNAFGLLTMLFISLSSGNIARTAGSVYRGDSFITFFLMLALLLMLKCFEEKSNIKKYIYAVLSAAVLGSGIVIWNGSPFIIVVYMFGLLLALVYGFIKGDSEILFSGVVLSAALVLTNLLQRIYIALGWARAALQLAGNDFFLFYIPILLCAVLTYLLVKNRHRLSLANTAKGRTIIIGIAAVVAIVVIAAAFGSSLGAIVSPLAPTTATGAVAATNTTKQAIVATTQELQKPSIGFLWSSFNLQLYLAPFGVILFIIFAYLIYKNSRFVKREHFNLNAVGFLVLAAYFAVTFYLQLSAIRFNAIISVPLAIFGAFGLYAIAKIFYNLHVRRRVIASLAICLFLILAIVVFYLFYPVSRTVYPVVVSAIIFLLAAVVVLFVYSLYLVIYDHFNFRYMVLAVILIILVFNFYNTYFESYTASQADGINPQFLSAMTWLKGNTTSNATVLALWPDGSVVEGWANRTSYMDSVGGENGTRIFAFSQFLFNSSDDVNYLYSIHRPEYFVVRNFWYEELGGIAQEGLVQNASQYGYIIMSALNSTNNGTASFFSFSSSSYPYYRAEMIIQQIPNTTNSIYHAYLGFQNSTQLTLMRNIIFLNTSDGRYSITQTGDVNNSVNFTLLVSYSGREVSGAYILGPKLVSSNVFKFTFLCNTQACPYDNSNVSLNEIYANGDTRIFKINYN